ncbi:MAG: tRNA (guanosine(46)-N7)-methyltransferase TrmB [Bacteroidales bacterium]|jgi:tRNA (guanine-N7-)-methyltransferase|nr:tRNA (guanosine(46)-N7)-methyltransferase TrmB [Bacteroidales bacterium]
MGKGKLAKFAENETFSNFFQPLYEHVVENGFPMKGAWRTDFFKNNNPVVLELGCGKGEYTVGLGEKYPEKNFIGVDIKGARIWRGLKRTHEKNLKNVAFLRTRIHNINLFFAPNEIDEIWITFPDPQPKKENKRLTCRQFLDNYKNLLSPEGIIHLKTDDTLLYEYTLNDVVKNDNHRLLLHSDDLYKKGNPHLEVMEIQTFYEQMWLDMGKKIKYIRFQLNQE